jgi:PAS domain S-box-containing protein
MTTEKNFQKQKDYQALIQSVTDYVVAINRHFRIIMANERFKDQFGVHPNTLCFMGWKNREKKCEHCLVERSFQDGKPHQNEEMVIMKDGRAAHMLIKSTPVRDENGDISYVLETATDITEKKRLESELNKLTGDLEHIVADRLQFLRKSEERYRTMFERSRDAILLTDAEGNILEINQAGVGIFGYKDKEELRAEKMAVDLFQDRESLRRFRKEIFQEGFVTEFKARLIGKGKRIFDAAITCNVMILEVMGKVTGHVMIIRDITQRNQYQKKIERQNKQLAILNAISMTVSSSLNLKELFGGILAKIPEMFQSDCIRIYLLQREEGVLDLVAHKGLSPAFVRAHFIESRRVGDGMLGRAMERSEPRVVNNLERSRDKYVDLLIREGLRSTAYIPLLSRGEPIGVMAVCSKKLFRYSSANVAFLSAVGNQIGIAVHNAYLYANLKEAYGDLKDAQDQLIRTEKLASLGKLAATIAHEINNPLAAVLNYIRLMIKLVERDRFSAEKLGDISRYLATMESETARCGEIVKNLLAFSRQSRMTLANHNFGEIIDKTLALISHDLELKKIRVLKDLEEDLPPIFCDFRQIQQVLLNLMSNASEAMEGGGTLTLSARNQRKEEFLEIRICDTGCGIPENFLEHVFEPFFTTKEEGKGVGLGLSVVYGIISRHNGSIEVTSELEKGTSFRVLLPFASSTRRGKTFHNNLPDIRRHG